MPEPGDLRMSARMPTRQAGMPTPRAQRAECLRTAAPSFSPSVPRWSSRFGLPLHFSLFKSCLSAVSLSACLSACLVARASTRSGCLRSSLECANSSIDESPFDSAKPRSRSLPGASPVLGRPFYGRYTVLVPIPGLGSSHLLREAAPRFSILHSRLSFFLRSSRVLPNLHAKLSFSPHVFHSNALQPHRSGS